MSVDAATQCSCCGRTMPRFKLHELRDGAAYLWRRCGLWIAVRLRNDSVR